MLANGNNHSRGPKTQSATLKPPSSSPLCSPKLSNRHLDTRNTKRQGVPRVTQFPREPMRQTLGSFLSLSLSLSPSLERTNEGEEGKKTMKRIGKNNEKGSTRDLVREDIVRSIDAANEPFSKPTTLAACLHVHTYVHEVTGGSSSASGTVSLIILWDREGRIGDQRDRESVCVCVCVREREGGNNRQSIYLVCSDTSC